MENKIIYSVSTATLEVGASEGVITSQKTFEDAVNYYLYNDSGFTGFCDQREFDSLEEAQSAAVGFVDIIASASMTKKFLSVTIASIDKGVTDEDGDIEWETVDTIYPTWRGEK